MPTTRDRYVNPASTGSDSVAITLGGTAISGSPYTSTVSAAPTSSPYYFMRRRHRLWLLAELSHLRHEDEPYAR
jgi:hypothetical protein